jgi:hypothetical protein
MINGQYQQQSATGRANNIYRLPTANRYQQPFTLQDTFVQDGTLQTQGETNTSDIPNFDHQIKLQH